MSYYWELIEKDGTKHEVKPENVPKVNRLMDNRDPVKLRTGTIPYSEIKHFRVTNRPYGENKLLEAAAQAFKEPIFTEVDANFGYIDKALAHKWVKKSVTPHQWESHYSKIPAYRKLDNQDSMIVVAFRMPIHEIDSRIITECTPEEAKKLT